MNANVLSLRQRMIIYYLQHNDGYVTGSEIASHLGVSVRTVRMDVAQINEALSGDGVQIISKHRFGYRIHAEDKEKLKDITRAAESFISKEERIRYMVKRLCLCETPIDLDDLADEMFVSKATLEHELSEMKEKYILPYPHIGLTRDHNSIILEKDERKRRALLCRLFADNWDYNGRGDTFYEDDFLDEKMLNAILPVTNHYLDQYRIQIEDINIVYFNLSIAIAVKRMQTGHGLKYPGADDDSIGSNAGSDAIRTGTGTSIRDDAGISIRVDTGTSAVNEKAALAVNDILDTLEKKLSCCFPAIERREIVRFMSCAVIPDIAVLRRGRREDYFSGQLLGAVDHYLTFLKKLYGLDFSGDQEFILQLCLFLSFVRSPFYHLNLSDIHPEKARADYAIEFELAFIIQPFVLGMYGYYLDSDELLYLSLLFAGALAKMEQNIFRTVIMTQYNGPVSWNLQIQAEASFQGKIKVTRLLSMYEKDNFDFSDTDLVLVTANKTIVRDPGITVIRISPFLTLEDKYQVGEYLEKKRFEKLYGHSYPSIGELMEKASWHEHLACESYFDILYYLGQELIRKGFADEKYLSTLLMREKIMDSPFHEPYEIVHSYVPAKKTHIEIGVLDHRLKTGSKKIRMVIMVCMTREDQGLIFKLYNELFKGSFNPMDTRHFTRREEYLDYLQSFQDERR